MMLKMLKSIIIGAAFIAILFIFTGVSLIFFKAYMNLMSFKIGLFLISFLSGTYIALSIFEINEEKNNV